MILSIFHISVVHLYVYFGEISVQVPCPLFKTDYLVFPIYRSFLYCKSTHYQIYDMKIFPHSTVCLLTVFFPLPCRSFLVWFSPTYLFLIFCLCFWASLVVQLIKNLPAMQETLVWFLCQEDPLEKGMVTHCSILA